MMAIFFLLHLFFFHRFINQDVFFPDERMVALVNNGINQMLVKLTTTRLSLEYEIDFDN